MFGHASHHYLYLLQRGPRPTVTGSKKQEQEDDRRTSCCPLKIKCATDVFDPILLIVIT